jgi:hypothetical protein
MCRWIFNLLYTIGFYDNKLFQTELFVVILIIVISIAVSIERSLMEHRPRAGRGTNPPVGVSQVANPNIQIGIADRGAAGKQLGELTAPLPAKFKVSPKVSKSVRRREELRRLHSMR